MTSLPRPTISFFALLLLAAPLAAAPRWVSLGPFGGSVYHLAVDPSDARVAYASMYGILAKTTDGGANWTTILHSGGEVAVDPAQHNTLYMANDRLLKSVNGGASWAEIGPRSGSNRPYISAVAVDPARASRVYAAGPAGVWRSTNRGASWKRTSLPAGAEVIAVSRPVGTVFVRGSSVYRSKDGGLTWKPLHLPSGVTEVRTFAVAPSNSQWLYASFGRTGLFRSADGGATWRATGRQPGAGDAVFSLAVSSRAPRSLWILTVRHGLYRSTDGGNTWTATGPSPVRRRVEAVATAPSSPRIVYAGIRAAGSDAGGVFASGDNGKTWLRCNRGLTGLEATALALDPQDPATLWTSTHEALFRSADSGASWTQVAAAGSFNSIVIDPTAPSTVFLLTGWGFWRTLDGGVSWLYLSGPNGPRPPCEVGPCYLTGGISVLRVGPEQPPKLWAGTDEGEIFTSSDEGVHWDRVELAHPACYISDLAFAPSLPRILYAAGVQTSCDDYTSLAAFFRSADGGATWDETGADLRLKLVREGHRIAVDPVDPRLIYLATWSVHDEQGAGVWKSTDGGLTWARAGEAMKNQPVTAVAVSPIAGVVWASSYVRGLAPDGRIFRSGDGGATWNDRTAGLKAEYVNTLVIDPHDPRRVYAAASGGVWVWTVEEP